MGLTIPKKQVVKRNFRNFSSAINANGLLMVTILSTNLNTYSKMLL